MVRGSGSRRRKLVWATNFFGPTNIAAGAKLTQVDLLSNLKTAGASVLGSTIMRVHTNLAITWLFTDTGPGLYVGYLVASPPVTGTYDPNAESGLDWMLNTVIAPGTVNRQCLVQGGASPTAYFAGNEFDIRAKRKIQELSQQFFFCAQNPGSAQVSISGFTKTLLALP
jgi:hypothetical protein